MYGPQANTISIWIMELQQEIIYHLQKRYFILLVGRIVMRSDVDDLQEDNIETTEVNELLNSLANRNKAVTMFTEP